MTEGPARVEPARPEDLAAIRALLEAAELPALRLDDGSARLFVARAPVRPGGAAEALLGCAGLERHGRAALLRSLVARPDRRGRGVGRALVERVAAEAAADGAAELVLLTMGAGAFFRGLGFAPVERGEVAPELLDSWEFRLHECVPAELLRRPLAPVP